MLARILERHAMLAPAKVAIADGDMALMYGDLCREARAIARALRSRGIGAGSRVALLSENRAEFGVLVAAASFGGFTLAPVNVRLHPEEQRELLRDADVSVAFAQDASGAQSVVAAGTTVVAFDDDEYRRMHETRGGAEPAAAGVRAEPLLMYATGGTSGLPKWCCITEGNLFAQADNLADAIGLNADDRYGFFMPFFHMAAGGLLVAALVKGATAFVLPRQDRAQLLHVIERQALTRTNLPFVVLRELAEAGALRALPQLRWLGTGNGTTIELQRELSRAVCPNVWGWYGQTEATNITTSPRSTAEAQLGFGCIGRAAASAQVRIVDAEGRDVGEGEAGELWTAGPHVMAGYWRRDTETAEVMRGGWLRSGDVVRRGPDGSLFIVDRLKEIIKSGGETISPRELEIALEKHPAIAEAAVIAVPHPRWGESPGAVVVLKPGARLSEQEVVDHCRSRLAAFKRPTWVAFAPGLPRNVAGKVRKDILRREYAARTTEGSTQP
ncbi:MAG TPA: AMP-binding protein [Ramlibacter sp.]